MTAVAAVAIAVAWLAAVTIAHLSYGWPLTWQGDWPWAKVNPPAGTANPPSLLEPIKTGLTVAAGIGGAVALVVAYRRQQILERQEHRDQYAAAVAQLGAPDPTTRLAGVYALANLADSWPAQRQQCVDVLCARLRLPWDPVLDPAYPLAAKTIKQTQGRPPGREVTYVFPNQAGELEVRKTILRVIGEHLRPGPSGTRWVPHRRTLRLRSWRLWWVIRGGAWSRLRIDLTGAVLPDTDWPGVVVPRKASFDGATFSGDAGFDKATFSGLASFDKATFSGHAGFVGATFSGNAWFDGATFSGIAGFVGATFSGDAWFGGATFSGDAWFVQATFSGVAGFVGVRFSMDAGFVGARFSWAALFDRATFHGAAGFVQATFSGDAVFDQATFHGAAGFDGTTFTGKVSAEIRRFLTSDQRMHLLAASLDGKPEPETPNAVDPDDEPPS